MQMDLFSLIVLCTHSGVSFWIVRIYERFKVESAEPVKVESMRSHVEFYGNLLHTTHLICPFFFHGLVSFSGPHTVRQFLINFEILTKLLLWNFAFFWIVCERTIENRSDLKRTFSYHINIKTLILFEKLWKSLINFRIFAYWSHCKHLLISIMF